MRPRIVTEVVNLNRSYIISGNIVKKIVSHALGLCGIKGPADLSVVFLDDDGIARYNREYKNASGPTDVLSFDMREGLFSKDGFAAEILISIETAARNSKVFATTIQNETALYVIHGILHLCGYDDMTKKQRSLMEARQQEILNKICRKVNLSKVLTPR